MRRSRQRHSGRLAPGRAAKSRPPTPLLAACEADGAMPPPFAVAVAVMHERGDEGRPADDEKSSPRSEGKFAHKPAPRGGSASVKDEGEEGTLDPVLVEQRRD